MSEFIWVCYTSDGYGYHIHKIVNSRDKAEIWALEEKFPGYERYYHPWRVE